jgi:hypothetical protein
MYRILMAVGTPATQFRKASGFVAILTSTYYLKINKFESRTPLETHDNKYYFVSDLNPHTVDLIGREPAHRAHAALARGIS